MVSYKGLKMQNMYILIAQLQGWGGLSRRFQLKVKKVQIYYWCQEWKIFHTFQLKKKLKKEKVANFVPP